MIYTHVAAALLSAAIASTVAWQIQGVRCHADLQSRDLASAKKALAFEQAARTKEKDLADAAQKIRDEYDNAQIKHSRSAAATTRAAAGLRDEIARLNARPPGQCAQAPGSIDEAAAARNALSECAGELAAVASVADQLSGQVTGLQAWASQACSPR